MRGIGIMVAVFGLATQSIALCVIAFALAALGTVLEAVQR